MKKIPESFELDQEDIKTAIKFWLNAIAHTTDNFTVSLEVKENQHNNAYDEKYVIAATAIKK